MMRSGTVVGSFKIDLKTVYDALGRYTNNVLYDKLLFRLLYPTMFISNVTLFKKIQHSSF